MMSDLGRRSSMSASSLVRQLRSFRKGCDRGATVEPVLMTNFCAVSFSPVLSAVIGKILDHGVLAGHHAAKIKTHPARLNAPGAGMLREMFHFRRVQQR